MRSLLVIFVSAQDDALAFASPHSLNIPYLSSPSTGLEGKPLPKESANPWKATSKLGWGEGGSDFRSRIQNMMTGGANQAHGEGPDLALQQAYADDVRALDDQIAATAARVHDTENQQAANRDGIVGEGQGLLDTHNTQTHQASLFNAAGGAMNQILLSEHQWLMSLEQAGRLENFVANDDNEVLHVLDSGDSVLSSAKAELDNLQENALKRADQLKTDCQEDLFDWNTKATKTVNDQTHALADLLNRADRLNMDFDRAHDKIVELVSILAGEQKEVTGVTSATALLQTRAQAVVQHPVVPLKGQSLEDIGFWTKLKVLKDLFEHKFGEALTPVEQIAKKFHDA